MSTSRERQYADILSALIQVETVSATAGKDRSKFYRFQQVLRTQFPHLTKTCEWEDFDGSFLLRWRGRSESDPILLMNHHDVVEAPGAWIHPPFAGELADGKLWGRGVLDTKGGLFAMLQAAEELIQDGFTPPQDIWFLSACTEETDGSGADTISKALEKRGIRFAFVLDEGGMIVQDPLDGVKGAFAMIGVGEKGCADLKFIARSEGGHASTPARNTPLVRLGKFMAEVDRGRIFKASVSPTVATMFSRLSASMSGILKYALRYSRLLSPLLCAVMPYISSTANAMLRTTVAFTMGEGSEGINVLPQEAWVIGDMRYSHHQGYAASLEAITALAATYNIEVQVLYEGFDSPLSDHNSEAFRRIEKAVGKVFHDVKTTPYIMTGASDCRFMSRVSDHCLRFSPLTVRNEQLDGIHGVNENVDIAALPPAVDFYRCIMGDKE